jgi:hypothetical protein
MKSTLAGCWRSRPFDQSQPCWPNIVLIPGTPVGRAFCHWPTQVVIPTTAALCEKNFRGGGGRIIRPPSRIIRPGSFIAWFSNYCL